jgi:hypothetical protein
MLRTSMLESILTDYKVIAQKLDEPAVKLLMKKEEEITLNIEHQLTSFQTKDPNVQVIQNLQH